MQSRFLLLLTTCLFSFLMQYTTFQPRRDRCFQFDLQLKRKSGMISRGCLAENRQLTCIVEIRRELLDAMFSIGSHPCILGRPRQEKFTDRHFNYTYVTRKIQCKVLFVDFINENPAICMEKNEERTCYRVLGAKTCNDKIMYSSTVCGFMLTATRNALPYFVSHYVQLGVQHIFLYVGKHILGDASEEPTVAKAARLGKLTLVPWDAILNSTETHHASVQSAYYQCHLNRRIDSNFHCNLDMDDFITATSISDVIASMDGFASGEFPWKVHFPECRSNAGSYITERFPCLDNTTAPQPKHCIIPWRVHDEGVHCAYSYSDKVEINNKDNVTRKEKFNFKGTNYYAAHVRRGRIGGRSCCNGLIRNDSFQF